MFTVGQFSQLAQVSKRLLRYYDQIGLLKPAYTDKCTQRRYYRAEQLTDLNRILALKDLGLSLEQIQKMLRDKISSDELQGMLLLKKAEIEQQLQAELQRIRNIEARLHLIRHAEKHKHLDVIVKQIPAQPVMSVRLVVDSIEAGLKLCEEAMTVLPTQGADSFLFAILHSDGIGEGGLDVEFGRLIIASARIPVLAHHELGFCLRQLPAVETMATYIVNGWDESILTGYNTIATWVQVNGYRFAGPPREIALQLPQTPDGKDGVAELQFPVEPNHMV
jgi:DNA-binding transcriptional MerR regulator